MSEQITSKVTSIRADEGTVIKFKSILEQFPNQSEALKALINAHEMAQAKGVLTGQVTSINDFQSHLDSIVQIYLTALDSIANTDNRVRMEYQELLASKDKTILDLQTKVEQANREKEQALKQLREVIDRAEQDAAATTKQISEYIQQAENAEAAKNAAERNAESTETARRELHDILHDTKQQLAESRTEALEAKSHEKEYLDKIKALEQQLADQMQLVSKAEYEIERLKTEAITEKERSEIAKQRATLEERDKNSVKIQELYSEIDELRQSLLSLQITQK